MSGLVEVSGFPVALYEPDVSGDWPASSEKIALDGHFTVLTGADSVTHAVIRGTGVGILLGALLEMFGIFLPSVNRWNSCLRPRNSFTLW